MNEQLMKEASFYYSISILRMLVKLELITDDEFVRIREINAQHYGTDLIVL